MFFLLFLFVFNQAKTSSLLSAEMTNTVIRMKKKDLSFHVGLEGRSPHSFKKSSWMEERALFFLGTKNTEQFTRKHCCITLIQAKRDRSLNINRNITQKYPAEAKKVKQKTRIRLNNRNAMAMQHSFLVWNILRVTCVISVHTRSEPLEKNKQRPANTINARLDGWT